MYIVNVIKPRWPRDGISFEFGKPMAKKKIREELFSKKYLK
jgi:hypothetical protein